MIHTALTENPTKKPTTLTSVQTNLHLLFHDQLKKDSQFFYDPKIFFRSQRFTMENALKTVDIKLSYNVNNQKKKNQNKKKRKHNIMLFNPPYSKHIKTNIRRISIKLISKQFPPSHKLCTVILACQISDQK